MGLHRLRECKCCYEIQNRPSPRLAGISPKPQRLQAANPRHSAICEGGTSRSGNRADQLQSLAGGEFMANLKGLASIVSELRTERTNLVDRLRHVDSALSVLGKLKSGRSNTKPSHTVSASARKRMSLAQKARWAKAKGHAPKPKRTISAAGRKRIAAAQRARWAKVKAGKAA
jgi:hypothetical protein